MKLSGDGANLEATDGVDRPACLLFTHNMQLLLLRLRFQDQYPALYMHQLNQLTRQRAWHSTA